MNLTVGFRTVFLSPESGPVILSLTGSSLYRIFVNGQFAGQGPARTAHGHYRVDSLDIAEFLVPSAVNLVAIEVAGYNVNSYYLLDQPAFLQAEISSIDGIIAATGAMGEFKALLVPQRIRQVERFSFQRTFTEYWRLSPGWNNWQTSASAEFKHEDLAVQPAGKLIPRQIAYPEYQIIFPDQITSSGILRQGKKVKTPWISRALGSVGPDFKGFQRDSLDLTTSILLQEVETANRVRLHSQWSSNDSLVLEENQWSILDLKTNLTGMIGCSLEVKLPSRLVITFDEILDSKGDVDWKRLGCTNAITLDLAPGFYSFESFEPYTLRYLKFNLLSGSCRVIAPYFRELANPHAAKAAFKASDPRLMQLFEAGRQSFRQNAVDIYMDCPSRERAGWLCDSYFIAKADAYLTGESVLEHSFLENFIMPDSFTYLPRGMLPMCYPADHNSGVFIPNWALWFILELEEYYHRTGDKELVEAARERVMQLFEYFAPFLNDDGLLEGLDSWVFIEWSKANDFVQDVNYPSNMLYAGALHAAGHLYGDSLLNARGKTVRRTVEQLSFDGEFFVDNAVRDETGLHNTANRTEVCQYFAFFFGVATPASHPDLWSRLTASFGPARDPKLSFPDVHPAAPFIGKLLRLEVLSRYGLAEQVMSEALDYFLPMAERTGTLWERDGATASCNHGFTGYLSAILLRNLLGLAVVNPTARELTIRFGDLSLEWCSGTRHVPGGIIELNWRKVDGKLHYQLDLPDSWTVRVNNFSGMELVKTN